MVFQEEDVETGKKWLIENIIWIYQYNYSYILGIDVIIVL